MSHSNQTYSPYDLQSNTNLQGNSQLIDPDTQAALLNPSRPTLSALMRRHLNSNNGNMSRAQSQQAGITLPSFSELVNDAISGGNFQQGAEAVIHQAQDTSGYHTQQSTVQGSYPDTGYYGDDRNRAENYGYPTTSVTSIDWQDQHASSRQHTGEHHAYTTTPGYLPPLPTKPTSTMNATDISQLQMLGRRSRHPGPSDPTRSQVSASGTFPQTNVEGYGATPGHLSQVTYPTPPSQQPFVPEDVDDVYVFADRTREDDRDNEDGEEVFGQGFHTGHHFSPRESVNDDGTGGCQSVSPQRTGIEGIAIQWHEDDEGDDHDWLRPWASYKREPH
ncbi:hypothetical protein TREMEDRAFT_60781 [Tremella mesenterica DSM 1558]|uniref:uncharacterized protein n=1 Tax=Tremella mesenterica (strain ATCC 24925 / CBS 8224 / DSM 1558 / NBRC 9311 / NRRL Y-6157 / RJB 2259-6 / UBC 559-6) TaxID=578456 RepID=UPI0003F4942F|nr:uncharacterized protein TREMEDRAFT_60781 [Tremella mesenterica DSM 1558]EIW71858.1 hypothetical protein TREMEDRAFT_60781 [Tremella mesenterica DSM 1558]